MHDINDIITKFLEAEEQNFSLFNYVNDINSEIERLEHNISDMRNQIEKYHGQGLFLIHLSYCLRVFMCFHCICFSIDSCIYLTIYFILIHYK